MPWVLSVHTVLMMSGFEDPPDSGRLGSYGIGLNGICMALFRRKQTVNVDELNSMRL